MKAIVFARYGSPDVLELTEVDTPTPGEREVLVRVHAASLNDWDWGALRGVPFVNRLMFGLVRPKKPILGSDVAGRVEAVGRGVRQFQPGDEVFGDLSGEWGGFAEYVCAREDALARKPSGMTFVQAAAIPQAAMLAVQGLQALGPLRPGQSLLINGAGGGVGTFAVQIARLHDLEVTGVDRADKLEMVRSLGATHVIDYATEDPTRTGRRYDFVLDVKTGRSILDWARGLKPGGVYATVGGATGRLLQALLFWPGMAIRKKRFRLVVLKPNRDLAYVIQLFESGKLVPVIDGPYPFRQIPEAFRRFGEGDHKGKIVVTMGTPADLSVQH